MQPYVKEQGGIQRGSRADAQENLLSENQRLGFTGLLIDTTQGQGCVALDEGTHE